MACNRQLSALEMERAARIKRNQQILAELNLPTLAAEFGASMRATQAPKRVHAPRQPRQPRVPMGPVEKRRSGRLAGVAAVHYSEAELEQAEAVYGGRPVCTRVEESYTQAHVQALGDHQEAWELFRDGYDEQGNRVYSREAGQTCHQCRQKTLGLRTACSGCHSLKGVFCGDCLFMRYGENVREAAANPAWTCPSCRDICNCSICRHRKGWAPTGQLYPRAVAEGYKSVAHMLVLNNVPQPAASPQAANETAPAAAPAAETRMPEQDAVQAAEVAERAAEPALEQTAEPAPEQSVERAPEQCVEPAPERSAKRAPERAAARVSKPKAQGRISALLPAKKRLAVKKTGKQAADMIPAPQKAAATGLGRLTRSRAQATA